MTTYPSSRIAWPTSNITPPLCAPDPSYQWQVYRQAKSTGFSKSQDPDLPLLNYGNLNSSLQVPTNGLHKQKKWASPTTQYNPRDNKPSHGPADIQFYTGPSPYTSPPKKQNVLQKCPTPLKDGSNLSKKFSPGERPYKLSHTPPSSLPDGMEVSKYHI